MTFSDTNVNFWINEYRIFEKIERFVLNHFLFDKPEKMNPETLIVINQKNQVGG